jgi:hypothetical protein
VSRPDAIAIAFVAYGVGAILLLVATLALVLSTLAAVEQTAASIEAASGPALATRLDRVEASLDEAESALRGFDTTLDATSSSARNGQALGTSLASSLRELAVALDVTVLGTRPFGDVGAEFLLVADRADALAVDLETTAGALDANRDSLGRLADEVAGLQVELAGMRSELGTDSTGDGEGDAAAGGWPALDAETAVSLARLVVVALLVWLAIPAVLVILHGRGRWRRERRARVAHVAVVHDDRRQG